MARWRFARFVRFGRSAAIAALLAVVFALVGARPARAQAAAPSVDLPPRDVGVVMLPDSARLPPPPADFERIDHGWVILEFPASVRDRGDALGSEADRFRARLSDDFGQPVLEHVIVRVARSPEQMAQLAPQDAPPPEYAAGVAYPSVHLAILAMRAPDTWDAPDLPELMRHELTHLALTDAVAGHHVPRWFDEGLAIHESGELPYARWKTLWEASLAKHLLPLADLDRGFPSDRYEVNEAYAESADFVRFLMRDGDRARFGSLLQRVRAGTEFSRTLEDAYGSDTRTLEYQWREELGKRFGIMPALTGGGLIWVLVTGLAVAAWLKKRRRAKEKLAEWAREEAEIDAAVAAAQRAEADAVAAAQAPEEDAVPRAPSVPLVEHDGRWHILH